MGEKFSYKNDNIIIYDKEGEVKHQSTCHRLFAVFIAGHCTITSGLLERAKKFGFSIIFLGYNLRHYGSWNTKTEGNVVLRRKQYQYCKLEIANHLMNNKLAHQIEALNQIRDKPPALKRAIASLKDYRKQLNHEELDLYQILGFEGIASRIYFKQMFSVVSWKTRRPRVKEDSVNCLLDIGYTLLFNLVDAMLQIYGFDLYCGVYHQEFFQRKSLVCDLVEPFRPLIDYRTRKAYQLGQVKEEDFKVANEQYRLFGADAKPYTQFYMETLIEYKLEIFQYIRKYYLAFMKDKPISEYPFFQLKKN